MGNKESRKKKEEKEATPKEMKMEIYENINRKREEKN